MNSKFFDTEKLVTIGNQMLKMISDRYEEVQSLKRPVVPKEELGFIRSKLQPSCPQQGEPLEQILQDTQNIIFPGSTFWSHPKFFAYYPSTISHSAVLAEMYATAFGTPGFMWIANPVQTELENVVCDWVVEACNLPSKFLLANEGGGTISTTVSDSVFFSVHVARKRKQQELSIDDRDPRVLKFVAYYTETAHSSTQKALHMKDVPYQRPIRAIYDEQQQNYIADVAHLEETIKKDIEDGLIPFWYGAAYGTTQTCGYDPIEQLGKVCQTYGLWFNVDAAYAGPSWFVPEFREKVKGLEYADTLQINFAKMMMVGLNGTVTYVSDKKLFTEAMSGQSNSFEIYKNKYSNSNDVIDYKDWAIALGRKFNALRLWWVMRSFGIEGLRQSVLHKVELAQYFQSLIISSPRFRTFTKGELGLTTFYFYHEDPETQNQLNKKLYALLNEDTNQGFISGSSVHGKFFLRVVVNNNGTTKEHMDQYFAHLNAQADKL